MAKVTEEGKVRPVTSQKRLDQFWRNMKEQNVAEISPTMPK